MVNKGSGYMSYHVMKLMEIYNIKNKDWLEK